MFTLQIDLIFRPGMTVANAPTRYDTTNHSLTTPNPNSGLSDGFLADALRHLQRR